MINTYFGNLINICIECHSKAHGVEFSRDNSGLVKEGLKRYKINRTKGVEWIKIKENKEKIHNLIMGIYDDYGRDKWSKLIDLIERDIINNFDLMKWSETGELNYYIRRQKFTF